MQYMDNFATFEKRSMYYKWTTVYYVSIILIHRSNTQMYDFVSLSPKYILRIDMANSHPANYESIDR